MPAVRWTSLPLALIAAATLHAQAADTAAFPPVPSSVPFVRVPANPVDSGYEMWRRLPQPIHKTAAGWTLRADQWDLLVATPRTMDAMDTSRIIDTTLANCRSMLGINTADSTRFATSRPWAPFDSIVHGRPVLVISIMPVLHNFTECGWKNLGRPAMIRRGLRFVTSFQYEAARDPKSAALVVNGQLVRLVQLARAPVTVVAGGGGQQQATDQLRLYIPFDAIAPRPDGSIPETILLIWNKGDDSRPEQIVIPGNILHAVWWDYLYWRAEALPSATRTVARAQPPRRRVLALPTPSDTGLRRAVAFERGASDAEAAHEALLRLNTATSLSTNDRRIGLMLVSRTFQAAGDDKSASIAASELTSMDPCAMSGTAGDARHATGNPSGDATVTHVGALFDATRPKVRCTAVMPGLTLLRGIFVPGLGQFTTWSRYFGLAGAALVVAGAYEASQKKSQGDAAYQHYLIEKSGHAPQYFDQAEDLRKQALTLAYATVGLWAAMAIEAEIQERVHASRLAAVREFWLSPMVSTGAAGNGSGSPGMAAGLRFQFR